MSINDKNNVLSRLKTYSPLVLELGCGSRKRDPEAIGIDKLDFPGVDIVGDVCEVLGQLPSCSVDRVHGYHFIEHVEDLERLIEILAKLVKPGGLLEFTAPHFSSPYFYSDPTHRRFFGLYTFCYFSAKTPFSRKVPTYQKTLWFELEAVDLQFKSSRPFVGRYALKFLIGKIFNSCRYMKELYEENFCYLFPCYEVRYKLRRCRN